MQQEKQKSRPRYSESKVNKGNSNTNKGTGTRRKLNQQRKKELRFREIRDKEIWRNDERKESAKNDDINHLKAEADILNKLDIVITVPEACPNRLRENRPKLEKLRNVLIKVAMKVGISPAERETIKSKLAEMNLSQKGGIKKLREDVPSIMCRILEQGIIKGRKATQKTYGHYDP